MKNTKEINPLDSWLQFNGRVLNEAQREENPLLERLNFLSIADSNLVEFIKTKLNSNDKNIRKKTILQTKQIENLFEELKTVITDELNLSFITMKEVKKDKKKYFFLKKIFKKKYYPLLQPLIVREELPLPDMMDDSMFIISKLKNNNDDGDIVLSVVNIPKNQIIKISDNELITSHEVISEFIGDLYKGKILLESNIFRIYRRINSIYYENNNNTSYLNYIEDQIRSRKNKNEIVLIDTISSSFSFNILINKNIKKRKRTYIDLSFIADIEKFTVKDKNFKYEKFKSKGSEKFPKNTSMFDVLSKEDVMVHFPYESFRETTIRFLEESAIDPNVVAIKQTLYRVDDNSKLIAALIKAAKMSKQVTVLLELKAKMDELHNLLLIKKLESVGINVIFGPIQMKTHAKVTLIIRREFDKLVKYSNISSGNFNEKTSKIYEDISYFTKNSKIGNDLVELFNHLGGFNDLTNNIHTLLISPFNFRSEIENQINNCIQNPVNASITIKCNALTDEKISNLLYQASNAGVKINLIIRGMCITIPNVQGLSDNIKIVSIVGRYLEHSRIYEFIYDDSSGENHHNIFIGSGDLMPRNLDHRIEVIYSLTNPYLKNRISDLLKEYMVDSSNSYWMNSDGSYSLSNNSEPSVQNKLISYYKNL